MSFPSLPLVELVAAQENSCRAPPSEGSFGLIRLSGLLVGCCLAPLNLGAWALQFFVRAKQLGHPRRYDRIHLQPVVA